MLRARTLVILAGLGVTAWVVVSLLGHPDADVDPELVIGPDGEPLDEREVEELERARLRAMARGGATLQKSNLFSADDDEADTEGGEESLELASETLRVGAPTLEDARKGFNFVMRKLEKLGRGRRRLTTEEWQDSYRAANDAFSALSMHLDATDDAQRAELEQAHHRLQRALRRVKVRGGRKFEPI